MSMKDCPSCGESVPVAASRCKNCFHDFGASKPSRLGGPVALLAAFAAMAVVGAGTFMLIAGQPLDQSILVDGDTQSVVWTTRMRSGVQSDRLAFADVVRLEYVTKASGGFEIVAVSVDGERKIIQEGRSPLKSEATQYARLMDKPLKEVNNTRGFHTMGDP